MTGMVEKVKAKVDGVLHKDHKTEDPTGPHSSHAANQADPRVDSDRIGSAGNTSSAAHGTTHTGTTGTHTGTTGTHTGMTGTHTGTTDPSGPHDSRMANKADPRVDSDRVGSAGNYGSAAHGTTHTGTTGTHTGMTGTHAGTAGTHVGSTGYSDPSGPHDSRMANKADPRVDSDRVGSAGNYGSAAHGTTHTGTTGTHTGMTGAHTGTTGTHTGMAGSDPSGPHDSRMANKADPRVDSDRYGSAGNVGSATHGTHTGAHTGMTGTHVGSTGTDPTGPHDSHLANKADPRVDSDRYGSAGNTGSAAYGTSHTGTTGTHTGNLAHRDNETGDLPKALVEPQSHAVPHSSVQTGTHGTAGTHGTHGTTDVHGKPSLMDKLNPKKDADFDGKRGVMD